MAQVRSRALVARKGSLLPAPGSTGRVHSVFGRACNMSFTQGELLGLLGPELPMASWCVQLTAPLPFADLIYPGMPARMEEQTLHVGALSLSLGNATLWQEDKIFSGAPFATKAVALLTKLTGEKGWPGFTALLAPDAERRLGCDLFLAQAHEILSELARLATRGMAKSKGSHVRAFCAEPHAAAALARRLSGLGPGLTPAGDDFLGGLLAGLFAQSPHGSSDVTVLAFARELAVAAKDTTPIAGQFLRLACQGSFSEHLAALARALGMGETKPNVLIALAEKVLSFGASSGADALAGLLWLASLAEGQRDSA